MKLFIKKLTLISLCVFANQGFILSGSEKTNKAILNSNQMYLQTIVNQSTLDQNVNETALAVRAALIKIIVAKLCTTEVPKWLTQLQNFALEHCYARIRDALHSGNIVKVPYKQSNNEAKKAAYEWIKKVTPLVTKAVVGLVGKEFPKEKTTKKTNLNLDNEEFNVSLITIPKTTSLKFKCIIQKIPEFKIKQGKLGSVEFICQTKQNLLKCTITLLLVYPEYRQHGWGKILLSTALGVIRDVMVKNACEKTCIKLTAVPDEGVPEQRLVDFYKSYGFIPKNKASRLRLYINKDGNILKKYEITDWQPSEL